MHRYINVVIKLYLNGRAMAEAVSRRPVTAEAWLRSRVSPCAICGGQSGTGTVLSPEYFGFPLSISFHRCSITKKNEKETTYLSHYFHHRVAITYAIRTDRREYYPVSEENYCIWLGGICDKEHGPCVLTHVHVLFS
jgi:hypothetical protein